VPHLLEDVDGYTGVAGGVLVTAREGPCPRVNYHEPHII
jgi:hypothetical protein